MITGLITVFHFHGRRDEHMDPHVITGGCFFVEEPWLVLSNSFRKTQNLRSPPFFGRLPRSQKGQPSLATSPIFASHLSVSMLFDAWDSGTSVLRRLAPAPSPVASAVAVRRVSSPWWP